MPRRKSKKTTTIEAPDGQSQPSTPAQSVTTEMTYPHPEALLEMARGEPNRRLLLDYQEVIHTLRAEKGFSFREIAEWLTENGVECDHNSVYRAYTKGMDPLQEAQVSQETDEEEREF